MTRYIIDPINEPDGEGNGWDYCDDSEATLFRVWDTVSDSEVEAFPTREKAEAFVAGGAND